MLITIPVLWFLIPYFLTLPQKVLNVWCAPFYGKCERSDFTSLFPICQIHRLKKNKIFLYIGMKSLGSKRNKWYSDITFEFGRRQIFSRFSFIFIEKLFISLFNTIKSFKNYLIKQFRMEDLKDIKLFVGILIIMNDDKKPLD